MWRERILIVSNDAAECARIARTVKRMNHDVCVNKDLDHAAKTLPRFEPTITLIGSGLHRQQSTRFLKALATNNDGVKTIILDEPSSDFATTLLHIGEIVGLEMAGTLPTPVDLRLLKSFLCSICPPPELDAEEFAIAIRSRKFGVRYSPCISRDQQRNWLITELEAVIFPGLGGEAIPVCQNLMHFANEHGLLLPLFESIIAQVKDHVLGWQAKGLSPRVSTNLCSALLSVSDFARHAHDLTAQFDIAPQQVLFKIDEDDMCLADAHVSHMLQELQEQGFSLALANVRGDRLSLDQLVAFPFEQLKLDSALVKASRRSSSKRALLETIILLGHNLDKRISATGVDSSADYSAMVDAGCDQLQGRAIGPFQSAPNVPRFMATTAFH